MLPDAELRRLAERLVDVPGVVAVLLGGSRARDTHAPDSDVDLGLYYRPPLDVDALAALARSVAGPTASVTAPGAWGPWVDGGAWLRLGGGAGGDPVGGDAVGGAVAGDAVGGAVAGEAVGGAVGGDGGGSAVAVDWIYRDVDRVRASWADAVAGRWALHPQVGHPLGVASTSYAGEVAYGVVLSDPTGEVTALQVEVRAGLPPALRATWVRAVGEAEFLVVVAAKAVGRGDTAYVAACLSRAVLLAAYAVHTASGRWVLNEKGLVAAAMTLPAAPEGFADSAYACLRALGDERDPLAASVQATAALVTDVRAACERCGSDGSADTGRL